MRKTLAAALLSACLLDKALIVGASVSGQTYAPDPTTLLVERYGEPGGIVRRVKPGRPSTEILELVSDDDIRKASVVSALDLFFWDTRGGDCEAAAGRAVRFVERVTALGRPLVVGNVPDSGGDCSKTVSAVIGKACAGPLCRVADLRGLYAKVRQERKLVVAGVEVPAEALFADKERLHPSRLGSQAIADRLKKDLGVKSCRAD